MDVTHTHSVKAEMTKPGVRGRVVALQQWAITWGIFLQFFVQYGSNDISIWALALLGLTVSTYTGCSFIDGTASFRYVRCSPKSSSH